MSVRIFTEYVQNVCHSIIKVNFIFSTTDVYTSHHYIPACVEV